MPNDHITEIKRRQHATDPYIPRCSCGWEGEHQTSRSRALDMLDLHHAAPTSVTRYLMPERTDPALDAQFERVKEIEAGLSPDRMAELEMEAGFTRDYDDPPDYDHEEK